MGFNDPALDQRPGFLAETGAYSGCVTSTGVFDLVGNLHEWVSDQVDASIAQKLPLKPTTRARIGKNRGRGVFMGGFFSTTNENGEGCEFITMATSAATTITRPGFAAVRTPKNKIRSMFA